MNRVTINAAAPYGCIREEARRRGWLWRWAHREELSPVFYEPPDSIRKDSADAEEIEHFKRENGVTRAVAADSVLAHIQSDADRAASAWAVKT
jgi:hypothetical protein